MKTISLTKPEIQSGVDRVAHAEGLILQLPKDHDGRNTWLLNYGKKKEACDLRAGKGLFFDTKTQSCETITGQIGKIKVTQKITQKQTEYIPYQLCPKCNGDGNLWRYNSPSILGTSSDAICDVCHGEKIILMSEKKEIIEVPGHIGIEMGSSSGECGNGFFCSIAQHDKDGWVNLCLGIDTDRHKKFSKEEMMKIFRAIIEDFKIKYIK